MPPALRAVASFSGDAARSFSGVPPMDLVRAVQPFVHLISEAG